MSKFTFSAFADEIDRSLDKQMDVLKKHDIHYIEFRSADKPVLDYSLDEIKAIKKKLDANDFKISAIGSPIGKVDIGVDFNKYLELFDKCLDIAEIFETKYIRMFSFYHRDGGADDYESQVIDRIGIMAQKAGKRGVILLHENEKVIYGDTAERCLKILKGVDSPNLWATFDPANFVQCNVEPYPHAYNLLKDYIKYVHIKDALFKDGVVTPAGEGDGNVEKLLVSLYNKGFDGFASIEPHLNNSLPGGGPKSFDRAYGAAYNLMKKNNLI